MINFCPMSRAKLVDHYLRKINEGDFEIIQVRQELEANRVPEDEIRKIVWLVDNELQRQLLTRTANAKSNEIIWYGLALAALGAIVTIATYTGLINMGNSFLLLYGPFLAGISLMVGGIARKRQGTKR